MAYFAVSGGRKQSKKVLSFPLFSQQNGKKSGFGSPQGN
jgi:hypothetical protein